MILLADDEPAFQRLTANWLRSLGHEVVTAGDGEEARGIFAQGGIDTVLLDLAMPPHLDPEAGLELIGAFAPAPVVVMTGHAQQELALRAVEAGAWDFLAKPIDPDMLKVVVARAQERARLARELAQARAVEAETQDMGLIGQSPAMVALRAMIRRIAPTRLPILVLGPSGTGKELVARALHAASPRAAGPLVPVHCGAIPADLLESELFGHLKGSFTGAHADRPGLVEAANGGTLFLDEIGEMPPLMQVKLLRFLADGTYQPIGAREMRQADVRIVAATHRDLAGAVAEGTFREDLYYRLKGMILRTPALSERPGDVALLASVFLRRVAHGPAAFAPGVLEGLEGHGWPGNVRELRAAVETAAALAVPGPTGLTIGTEDLALAIGNELEPLPSSDMMPTGQASLQDELNALEHLRITQALERTGNNHTHTARELGLSRVGLLKKMARMGLR
ncbi:sigma-54-dependent Fis family transcriptional regulator [Novosphingobium profundi]|uniref:sigma-54-dependent transcriptional regulator n=1 Tax=Novosphingobium profundi TaxID=1774954 RepID=UPI001BD9C09A|nr:sigma-54 dependent transcriptional regulator [Novosphingobium profundi]MBT0670260.1 sigma-54-dependent Fis family transcriptional regulator [Novosphingobium profundi]